MLISEVGKPPLLLSLAARAFPSGVFPIGFGLPLSTYNTRKGSKPLVAKLVQSNVNEYDPASETMNL